MTSEVPQALKVSKQGPELCRVCSYPQPAKGPATHHALHMQDPATALNTAEQLQLLAQEGSPEGAFSPEVTRTLGTALVDGFARGSEQVRLLAAALATLRAWCSSTDTRAAIATELPLEELVR